ncbi:hypothetical protein [Acidisarcina polymorpha]|uniref:hypothetical protein n=1 Tax=Acidisarcina polymorpha TaxID=2211140 RepID=UPI000DEECDAD|nr:hypothetical protein [Acidisarcina polymorpha]
MAFAASLSNGHASSLVPSGKGLASGKSGALAESATVSNCSRSAWERMSSSAEPTVCGILGARKFVPAFQPASIVFGQAGRATLFAVASVPRPNQSQDWGLNQNSPSAW